MAIADFKLKYNNGINRPAIILRKTSFEVDVKKSVCDEFRFYEEEVSDFLVIENGSLVKEL